MWTQQRLNNFMQDVNFKSRTTGAEVKKLTNILMPDESLIDLLEGRFTNIYGKRAYGNGLVVATNKRIIFFRIAFMGAIIREEILLDEISSIKYTEEEVFGAIVILTTKGEALIEQCINSSARQFSLSLERLVLQVRPLHKAIEVDHPLNLWNHIENLEKLMDEGILTEDEFEVEKEKVLSPY